MHRTSVAASPAHGTQVCVVEIQPLLCSITDAQKLLGGVSERQVYRFLDEGQFESVPIGGRRMILVESITAYIQRQRSTTTTLPPAQQRRPALAS